MSILWRGYEAGLRLATHCHTRNANETAYYSRSQRPSNQAAFHTLEAEPTMPRNTNEGGCIRISAESSSTTMVAKKYAQFWDFLNSQTKGAVAIGESTHSTVTGGVRGNEGRKRRPQVKKKWRHLEL